MQMLFILAALVAHVGWANEIDNHLVGDPIVDCQDTMVSLTFTTEKPFTGRVYVQGLADDDRCSRNFATNTDQSKFSMMIQNGDCAMARQRVSGTLEGIMFSLTIVVSFHGTFVTKVDRAYRCMCFFRNIKRVTNLLDMSAIGTTELLDTAKMPTCTYSIHANARDGPLMRYGKVGDKIFHAWECDDESQGFLVHSCWVNDGRGNRFDLLDIDGCAVDPIIQADIKYDESLNKAYTESWGYKFSDTSVLNYQCVVELCKKAQGECDGLTPPSCGRGKRAVRAASMIIVNGTMTTPKHRKHDEATLKENEMDLVNAVDILDTLSADDLDEPTIPSELMRNLNGVPVYHPRHRLAADDRLCLSTPSFGILLAITVILFITSVVASSMLCYRSRFEKS
jgi:hypothetical protein